MQQGFLEMKMMDSSTKQTMYQQTHHYSAQLLFETAGKKMLDGLTLAKCNINVGITSQEIHKEKEITKSGAISDLEIKPVIADYMMCNCCQIHFPDREEQIGHYKCDWHRYNLHRRLKGLPCVSEEEFEETAGDVSSISGSDEDDENDETDKEIRRQENDTHFFETPDTEGEGRFLLMERKFSKVFFKTKDEELISLFRCLLHHKKSPLYEPNSILTAVSELLERKNWMILMVSAGHFAGAVFNGNEVIDHKTFHRYTVRAKRGTAQSTKDGQGCSKSAGSTLRRYNEAALIQDVQDLLSRWGDHIQACHFVFIRVPVANRVMFFGGKNQAFRKDDPRIRVIPFATRRPTFNEAKRVHQVLASVECYGKAAEVEDIIPLSPTRLYDSQTGQLIVRKNSPVPKPVRAASKGQSTLRPDKSDTGSDETVDDEGHHAQETEIDMDLVETLEEIDFSGLKQFESTVKRKYRKKKPPSNDRQKMERDNYLGKELVQLRNALFTACKIGCLDSVQTILEKLGNEQSHNATNCLKDMCENDTIGEHRSLNLVANDTCVDEAKDSCVGEVSSSELALSVNNISTKDHCNQSTANTNDLLSSHLPNQKESLKANPDCAKIPSDFLNIPLSDDGTTFLQVAAKEGHPDIVTALLSSGADPAIKNKEGKVAYSLGESEVRNTLRRFMAKFPVRYDYNKAQIPSPLTAEMEAEKKQKASEKRKAKKKATNERKKDQKVADGKMREENQQRDRFLALSDREKRALAAEKRILQQYNDQGMSKPVLSRCWQCGTDITGAVPFEYSDYKFCTTKCLREHRSKSATSK